MTLVKVNNPVSRSFEGIMNDLMNEFPATMGKTIREDVLRFPPANIVEGPDAYFIELSTPGFEKADFVVNLDKNLLSISAGLKDVKSVENTKIIRKEFTNKAFKRSFTVDDKIDAEKIIAKYERGILILELPKKEVAKSVAKEINVQ